MLPLRKVDRGILRTTPLAHTSLLPRPLGEGGIGGFPISFNWLWPGVNSSVNQPPTSFPGHCHCGGLGFEFRTALPRAQWPVRQCRCSYCRSQGALWTSDPSGQLRFHGAPATMTRYRFGQRSADFLLCARCGTLVGAVAQFGPCGIGVINLRALDVSGDSIPPARAVDYANENPSTRELRRRQNWTPIFDLGTE